MSVDTWVSAGMTAVAAAGGVISARAARRTKRQERRDDFTVVTDRMERELRRQGDRIDELESEAASQQEQLTGQGAAIAWLVDDRGRLIRCIRKAGMEPPSALPIPPRARPFLTHLDA